MAAAAALVSCGQASGGSYAGASRYGPPTSGPTSSTFDFLDAAVEAACTVPQIDGYPSGPCSQLGLHCIATDTSCCDCIQADMRSCGAATGWVCGDHLQRSCPDVPPAPGSACDAGMLADLGCTYCVPPGGSYGCQNGTWQRTLDFLYCSAPLVGADAGH